MEQFKIRQNGFNEIRRGMLIKTIPLLLIAVLVGLGISYFNSSRQESEVNVYFFVIPMVLIVLGFSIYRSVNRQKEIFDSYKLSIDNNSITREQSNTQTISIPIEDIREICKNSNGSLTIKGNSTVNIIIIPAQIENFEKLEQLLSEIMPISEKNKDNKSFLQKHIAILSFLLPIATLGLMAVVFLWNNKIIVGICGTLLLVILTFSFVGIQRNKNIDNKTKRGRWWLIIVVISILLALFYKIFA